MAKPAQHLQIETDPELPLEVREQHLAEVKRRLETGELDSDTALKETAAALLDGDPLR